MIKLSQKELRTLHVVHVMGPMSLEELEDKFHEPHGEVIASLMGKGLVRKIEDQGYFSAEYLMMFNGDSILRGFVLYEDLLKGWMTAYLDGTVRRSTDVEVALWGALEEALR